jgi:glycosyltransferase involved in cell wall biosynthesis
MGTSAVNFFKSRDVHADLRIISGGLDTSYFTPARQSPRFDVVFAGRLVPIKRVDLFLETLRIIKASRPDISAAVIGDGPLSKSLQALSIKMGLSENVHFAGFQGDMAPWLNQARIFVLTSVSEGLSLAMMEAMACGLPVVVPDIGDLGDLVVDQVNGFLTSRPDPQLMADCISKLLDQPETLEQFSRSARQAAERLSIMNAVESWDQVFEAHGSPGRHRRQGEVQACAG